MQDHAGADGYSSRTVACREPTPEQTFPDRHCSPRIIHTRAEGKWGGRTGREKPLCTDHTHPWYLALCRVGVRVWIEGVKFNLGKRGGRCCFHVLFVSYYPNLFQSSINYLGLYWGSVLTKLSCSGRVCEQLLHKLCTALHSTALLTWGSPSTITQNNQGCLYSQ